MPRYVELEFDGEQIVQRMGLTRAVYNPGDTIAFSSGRVHFNHKYEKYSLIYLNARGRFKHRLELDKPGLYRIGANYGHFVTNLYEETDPIKRVMREFGLSTRLLSASNRIGDRRLPSGGLSCEHVPRSDYFQYEVRVDRGDIIIVEPGKRTRSVRIDSAHVGCQVTPDMVRVSGARVVLHLRWETDRQNDTRRFPHIHEVIYDQIGVKPAVSARLIRAELETLSLVIA